MKKHKSRTLNEASASNSTAEVFILPPDLLAKLGISLGNVQHSETVHPTTSLEKDNVQSIDHSPPVCLPENRDGSSIIQTANLMKESVFLSPTFLQTAPSSTENEDLIVFDDYNVKTNKTSSECSTVSQQCNNSFVSITEINSVGEQWPTQLRNETIVIKPSDEVTEVEYCESFKEYQVENHGGDLILTNVPHLNANSNETSNGKLAAFTDEHADEAYLSDCSNSYSGCSPESMKSEFNKVDKSQKDKFKETPDSIAADPLQSKNGMNVIRLASDTVFASGDVNSTVTLHESHSDLTVPYIESAVVATIQAIAEEQVMHNDESSDTNFISEKVCTINESLIDVRGLTDKKITNNALKRDSEKTSQQHTKLVIMGNEQDPNKPPQENTDSIFILETNRKDFRAGRTFEDLENNRSNINLSNNRADNKEDKLRIQENITNTQDKVKEIAAYLSEIANVRKNIPKYSKKPRSENIKEEKEAKVDPVTSKLCIQGVEKPGGKIIQKENNNCVSVLKTYQRASIKKTTPKVTEMFNAITSPDSFQITENNQEKSIHESRVRTTHPKEHCICYDFGNLAYYDCEMLYEHIHFWSHKNIEYDLETFYSIYNEDTVLKQCVDFSEDAHQIEHDNNIIQDSLCWHEIYTHKNGEESTVGKYKVPSQELLDGQKPKINSDMNSRTTPQPSTSAICTENPTKISINFDCNSITARASNDVIHFPKSATCPSVSEVTAPPGKSVILSVNKSPKNASISDNVDTKTSTSVQDSLSLKQSNNLGASCSTQSRSIRKYSVNLPSISDNLSTPENKTDTLEKEQTVTDVSIETKHVSSRITRRHSNHSVQTLETLIKNNKKITKSAKINEKDNLTEEIKRNASKATDSVTYTKITSTDSYIETKTLPKSTNDSHETTETSKSRKRSTDTAKCPRANKVRITESSLIFEGGGNDAVQMHSTEEIEEVRSNHENVEKQSKSNELCALPQPTVQKRLPSKVENVEPEDEIMPLDNSVECTTMTINDCSKPEDSFVAALENSTLSSDTTMNGSQTTEYYMVLAPLPMSEDSLTCGLCQENVEESQWMKHISSEHDYIAWRLGESPLDLDDEIGIKKHLQGIANRIGGLKCSKCGMVRKFAKKFLDHIRSCNGVKMDNSTQEQEDENMPLLNYKECRKSREKTAEPPVTCGVCKETVERSDWIRHIQSAHKYLAWTSEEQPLDLNDDEAVKQHLKHISKYYDGLLCTTCGVRWSYVKKFLQHIKNCDPNEVNKLIQNDRKLIDLKLPPVVTCGVCKLDVEGQNWIKHIQVAHEYMAWVAGETPLDPDNPGEVKKHLDTIARAAGRLVCSKCGETRKSAYAYQQHSTICAKTGFKIEVEIEVPHEKDEYVCGVCHEKGKLTDWNHHAMTMHYNIAWKVGDIPINIKNPYTVEKYLKVFRKKHELLCRVCKQTRSSCCGFYAHILTCGKTEEEIEAVQDVCEICNNKYLCIYRNQHMAAHRDSERRREMREMLAKKAADEALNPPPPPEPGAKRRAAEKAKQGILKHSSNTVDGVLICGCGASFKDSVELDRHDCLQKQTINDDGSDVSVKMENESEESAEEIIDSGVSDEEDNLDKKKKRVRTGEGSTKVQRMPYRVNNYAAYLSQAFKDFARLHLTAQRLFDEWRDSECTIVPLEETAGYLPQLTESCKVRFGDKSSDEWTTYTRFEAKNTKVYSMFTGGATQCMSWAPPNLEDDRLGYYLAVSTHRGPDVPRCVAGDTPRHAASLQIWDFKQFEEPPRCALCIAHEYGTVWAMDWCPSGARDARSPQDSEELKANLRLGLLAIACSNGSAYILAVPYPPPAQRNDREQPVMYKLKPVAELRLTMTSERRIYQATSINWSQQKGHSTIIVGYSDGTTALYDLNTESPFLTSKEEGVTIYYPFQDRRPEGSSVNGVGITATSNESYSIGGQFSTSVTGGTLCGVAARPSARVHLAASGAVHAAHWPAVTLAGDSTLMRAAVTEMEWWGGGRRVGAGRAWAACARCARAASAAAPALRVHRQHPAYPEIKKLIVALLLMVPLGSKKPKVTDDLSIVMEPLTYEDAVAKYGLQLTFVTKTRRSDQAKAQEVCNASEFRPDRFPLSDIVALAFCPSARFHDRVAVATHTGVIFVINMK